MGQVLHGSARTTAAVRRAIQDSQASLNRLAGQYGINPKTVAKWRKRSSVEDARMGPEPRSTVLTEEQEAVAVAFRSQTLLPLDDCLYTLQATMPRLTRSALHRCFQRHGISRLSDVEGISQSGRSSSSIPSATSISILPRCAPSKASSISLWPLIEPASSPMPSCMSALLGASPATSSGL